MPRKASLILVIAYLATGIAACERKSAETMSYPAAERGNQADDYHGVSVADPYRWMESQSPELKSWVDAQNALAEPFLAAINKREYFIEELTRLWDYERIGTPRKYGDHYFYTYNPGSADHDVIMMSDRAAIGGRVVLDPNSFSKDATVALSQYSVSPDGAWIAYSTTDGGTDWDVWRIRNTATGVDEAELIRGTKFTGAAWLPDASGFFYSRYPKKADGEYDDSQQVSVYFHARGTSQDSDRLIYSVTDNASRDPYAQVSEDGRYLLLMLFDGFSENGVLVMDIAANGNSARELFNDWDGFYDYLGQHNDELFFKTTAGAPRGRILAINASKAGEAREVIEQGELAIDDANLIGDEIVVSYLKDVKTEVRRYGTDGEFRAEVSLPGAGTGAGFLRGSDTSETFFTFTSHLTPAAVYRLHLEDNTVQQIREPELGFDNSKYIQEQVFYPSKDGTLIPMYLIHRRDLKRDASHPTLLYGYGGFNSSLTPTYSTPRTVWLEAGGVIAIPNLRGGGEYGAAWHAAGTKLRKQNVFDDFIAAARWLIDNKYTSAAHLGIMGRSNGGLLVGAVMAQEPDLFGAALPAVGVMDMLRYHTPSANAKAWSSDYGLSTDPEEFKALYAYSPVHNLKKGTCYPPTLVSTAYLDDRVVPWHSYKFAAELQYAQSCENPVLLRVETRAGHGAGKPKWMTIEDYADQWAFLAAHLGLD